MPRVFVYGALMTHPVSLARGAAARVDDHAVRFVVPGLPLLEPSFAALEPAPGEVAWGVVAEWTADEWARARRREWGYDVRTVRAIRKDGTPCEADALFLPARRRIPERVPSARYATLLLRGAEHHAFPEEVIARYRSLVERGARWTRRLGELLGRTR